MQDGCVHVYTGAGKGKTTAAAGLAARAAGQGLRVGFFQFLKNGVSGEVISLAKLGVQVVSPQGGGKFVWEMDEAEKRACAQKQSETLARAAEMAERLDVLVLDEAIAAMDAGVLDEGEVTAFVKNRPRGLELVLTGRGASAELLQQADYVTEMQQVAHPYEAGRKARRGIEY